MRTSFLWGAATSAHQVEGNNVNSDWWEWEQKTTGVDKSGRAADHYVLFEEDFKLARELGHNAHRISIEWSRIEPKKGEWDRVVIDHYRDVLKSMRENGLKSFVTLHHFTNPKWFADWGGWERSNSADLFAKYAKKVVEELGDLVDFWITINEPMVYATQSYWRGRWTPQKRSLLAMWRVVNNLVLAHRKAYKVMHSLKGDVRVGVAKHVISFLPDRPDNFWDGKLSKLSSWWFNHRFLGKTKGAHDFIGVNFYFTSKKKVKFLPPSVVNIPIGGPVSDLDWPISEEGFEKALLDMRRYKLPVYVTENGLADAEDKLRPDFIRTYLRALERAQSAGVDVRGYLHWSLLDNFEWDLGYSPRFGLVEVDYESMSRTPRSSAHVYKAIIEQAKFVE